ncbi:MAG: redox-regulated ATPase YchF [Planctomycetes bacterium]|nr:redox-regulated ATPase YchF [Planctomycetota bacterium]
MRIGLVGFPGAGRSTLFTAFSGIEPAPPSGNLLSQRSTAAVKVPDQRLEWLRELCQPRKYTPAIVEFVDFAGIPRAAERGKPELFAAMREADALVCVVSSFPGAGDAAQAPGTPLERRRSLEEEFLFADLEGCERRVERLRDNLAKGIKKTRDRDERELRLLERCRAALEAGQPLAGSEHAREEEELLAAQHFLGLKPRIVVVNAAEGQDLRALEAQAGEGASGPVFAIRGQVEAEIARMAPEERGSFLAEYGLERPASEAVIRAAFAATRSISFFTIGEDEVRAWVIQEGDTALVAAGKVHTDIARGFIRAEVVSFPDLQSAGSLKAAKARNTLRLEGKDYVVRDGETVHFRFSV